jgi:flagellar hook-basal body complex protein FliE
MTGIKNIANKDLFGEMPALKTDGKKGGSELFKELLRGAMNTVNENQLSMDQKIREFATGDLENVHELMIDLEKASISLELVIEIRNKLIEAYQELMRTQV